MATENTRVPLAAGVDVRYKSVVFFDGGCPMCRREIDHYRRNDQD
jgi:hypothetical protein